MVSIFGMDLGEPAATTPPDDIARYPTTFGSTRVTFNGLPAGLLYVSPTQINAVVPYGVAGFTSADVVVTRYPEPPPGFPSNYPRFPSSPFPVPVLETSPSVFTANGFGTGQGAIRNLTNIYLPGDVLGGVPHDRGTPNSEENPAPKGSAIRLFATGAGIWSPAAPDGSISLLPVAFTAKPVSLTIGGRPAQITYAGTSPFEAWGFLQILGFVPNDVESGQQPVVLKIGENDNAEQGVTMAIK